MIRHSIGILATALALAAPLTCAAETIEFDRNSNGKPDISFALEIDGVPVGNIVAFDNDEDGMYDFGFQGGCNGAGDGVLCAMWIDKNGDGEVQKKEVRKLHSSLPWATFPSSYVPSSALNGNGGRDYFMDYTDDDYMTAREIGRDLNCDGDIERDVFLAA